MKRVGAAVFLSLSCAVSALAAEEKAPAPAASAEDRGASRRLLEAGKEAFRKGAFDEAAKLFGQAFAKDPTLDAALFNQAYALRRAERYTAARAAYTRYLERNPNDLDTHYALGRTAQLLGDDDAARRWYAAYVEKETRAERARYVQHAKAQLKALGPAPADEPAVVVEEPAAPAPAPYDAAGRFAEAMRLYQQKEYRQAAVIFLEVYASDEKRTKALYRSALALRQAGDLDAARERYEKYLLLEPTDPDAVYGLAETERAAGRTERAVKLYERYLEVEKRASEAKWVARARELIAVLRATLAPAASPAVVEGAPEPELPAVAEAPAVVEPPAVAEAPVAEAPAEAPVASAIFRGPAELHRPLLARASAVDALLAGAQRHLDEGRPQEALSAFTLALSRAPSDERAAAGRASALAALDDGERAQAARAERRADDVESLLTKGEERLRERDSVAALKAFQRALARAPSSARPHWGLARAYEQAGQASAAKHHYRLYRESAAPDRDPEKADEAWWKLESL